MAHSLSFNNIDLSAYGLVVNRISNPIDFQTSTIQLPDISYAFNSKRPPKIIIVSCTVTGADRSTVNGYLDSIRLVLNENQSKKLALDSYSGRYWNARVLGLTDMYASTNVWQGDITFQCLDPFAYSTTQTQSTHSIDATPKTVSETPGGSAIILPVYRITINEFAYTGLSIKNENTSEELTFNDEVSSGEMLEIDCATWVVKLDGTESMDISGQFPRLLPGQANPIKITGAWTTGKSANTLEIIYRDKYA